MSRTIGFTSADAARVRFGLSCLWEVLASVRVLREPGNHSVHLPWVRRVQPVIDARLGVHAPQDLGAAFDLLGELVGSGVQGHYAPDLLTPPPTSLEPSIETELQTLVSTPPEVVRQQLAHLRGRWTPRLQALSDEPARGLEALADVVALYWESCLAPYWSRITAVAEAEVFHRGQQQAADGTATLLNDLHERVRWDGARLTVSGTTCLGAHDLEGGGLCLVPSVFVWPSVLVVADGHTAQLAFPVPGDRHPLGARLRDAEGRWNGVLGRSKARLLAVLENPLSTTDAADRLALVRQCDVGAPRCAAGRRTGANSAVGTSDPQRSDRRSRRPARSR